MEKCGFALPDMSQNENMVAIFWFRLSGSGFRFRVQALLHPLLTLLSLKPEGSEQSTEQASYLSQDFVMFFHVSCEGLLGQ